MASDARAVAAWRRDRGEAVEDEDEEEAAVDEHDRQTAARERAARCVEIKWKASRAIDATRGADGPRSEGGKRILLDNSRVYVRFLPFVSGGFHLGRLGASQLH